MPLTPAQRDIALDYVISNAGDPLYLALLHITAGPTDDGSTITECDYPAYARAVVATADWNASVDGVKSNLNEIAFTTADADDTAVGWALVDAGTGGLIIAYAPFVTTTIHNGQTPKYTPGTIGLTLDDDS